MPCPSARKCLKGIFCEIFIYLLVVTLAMAISLYVEPRKVYRWTEFKKEKGPYSIGLDGIIDSPTKRDPRGPYANFDHHSKVDRIATRSTSEQVHMEINMGLFDTFRYDGVPQADVYVNDPDEDTCLSWWLLKNFELVRGHANPRINRLVYCEDRLDCTAGAYPFGDTKMRRQMAWIFEPYNEARFQGRVAQMDASEMRNVMESVEARINNHIFGEGRELALEGHYEKIGGGEGWSFVRETGPASRMAMYNDGICAFASLVAEKPDGSRVYTLGRKSVWVPFDLRLLYEKLNQEEAEMIGPNNLWGGSDTIGGSPRETGSMIEPERLQELISTLRTKA